MFFKISGTKPEEKVFLARRDIATKSWLPIKDKEGKQINSIGGRIVDACIKTFEYQGKDQTSIDVKFEYKGASHTLNCGRSNLAKSILNTIAGAEAKTLENISIGVYHDKSTGYNKVFLKDLSDPSRKLPWALSIDDQNALVEKTLNKKGEVVSTDDTDLMTKFSSLLEAKRSCGGFPTRLVSSVGTNALDFLDFGDEETTSSRVSDDISLEDLSILDAALESVPADKATKKNESEEINIDDIPF